VSRSEASLSTAAVVPRTAGARQGVPVGAGPVASVEPVSAALEDDVVHRWVEHLELCQERLGAPGTGVPDGVAARAD